MYGDFPGDLNEQNLFIHMLYTHIGMCSLYIWTSDCCHRIAAAHMFDDMLRT